MASKTGFDKTSHNGPPHFLNVSENDYRLSHQSELAIDHGMPIQEPTAWNPPTIQGVNYKEEVFLDLGLCPDNTDWSSTPPRVHVARQGDYGTNWERGAYIYTNNSIAKKSLHKVINVEIGE